MKSLNEKLWLSLSGRSDADIAQCVRCECFCDADCDCHCFNHGCDCNDGNDCN